MIEQIPLEFIEKIAIALAIGALLGMEREYSKRQGIIGVRTFAMVSLLGALFVLISEMSGETVMVFLGFVAVMLLVVTLYAANLFKEKGVGMTTSIALLLSYAMGVFVAFGNVKEAVFVTIAVAIVMYMKKWLHRFVEKLTGAEVLDFLEFLALVGVIYPVIPAEPIVLYGVSISLMDLWLMLFMLALINFGGFIGSRYLRGKRQIQLRAFLGGLVSSTAALYSMCQTYAKKRRGERVLASSFLFINTAMLVRNLVLLAVLLPGVVQYVGIPVLGSGAFLMLSGLYILGRQKDAREEKIESPFQVKKSVYLVAKLAVVLVAFETLVVYLPDIFYIASFMGGITSSASTMASMPVLVQTGKITMRMAAIGVSIALMADLLVGNVIVYAIGGAWGAAKRAITWGMAAAAIYLVIFSFLI